MKRTTIFAEEALIEEMKDLARHERKSVSDVLREAMETYINLKKRKKKYSIIGIGESGREDIAEIHEDILWQKSEHGKR